MSVWEQIIEAALQTSELEIVAVIFGLSSVWFSKKENILVYPTGIISVLIYIHLCFEVKLYADVSINAFYFIMSVYGWYKWNEKGAAKVEISKYSLKENGQAAVATLVLWGFLYIMLSKFTDSDVAEIDSLTTAIFFIGMWLMAWKKIENWLYWIVGDLISVPLYAHKGYYLSSIQFLIFTALAIWGYYSWKKRLETA